jgi:hypothetical protein
MSRNFKQIVEAIKLLEKNGDIIVGSYPASSIGNKQLTDKDYEQLAYQLLDQESPMIDHLLRNADILRSQQSKQDHDIVNKLAKAIEIARSRGVSLPIKVEYSDMAHAVFSANNPEELLRKSPFQVMAEIFLRKDKDAANAFLNEWYDKSTVEKSNDNTSKDDTHPIIRRQLDAAIDKLYKAGAVSIYYTERAMGNGTKKSLAEEILTEKFVMASAFSQRDFDYIPEGTILLETSSYVVCKALASKSSSYNELRHSVNKIMAIAKMYNDPECNNCKLN